MEKTKTVRKHATRNRSRDKNDREAMLDPAVAKVESTVDGIVQQIWTRRLRLLLYLLLRTISVRRRNLPRLGLFLTFLLLVRLPQDLPALI